MKDWKAEFWELKEYIKKREDLVVTEQSLAVPEGRREEFYGLVERSQKAMACQVLKDLEGQGRHLAGQCVRRRISGATEDPSSD